GSLSAYGVFNHRHGAEIEQGLAREVTFTPHLVPLDRGILATMYVRVAPGTTEEVLGDVFERAYAGEPFVRLTGSALPEIKHVAHTNFCDIGWRVHPSGRAEGHRRSQAERRRWGSGRRREYAVCGGAERRRCGSGRVDGGGRAVRVVGACAAASRDRRSRRRSRPRRYSE